MSNDAEPVSTAYVAPIIIIGIAVEPGKERRMGYVIHEENLSYAVENGAVHDLLTAISMMMDHPSIVKAVSNQDLFDRLEAQ